MKRLIRFTMAAALFLNQETLSWAVEEDAFSLFEEEAKVITASKRPERIHEAPGIISVITRNEIETFGYVNLVDVLNRAPSIQHMSSYLWVQAKPVIRGNLFTHADNQVLILINGRPYRDANEANSNYHIYTSFPIDLIERIEIVRGPGSVLYGSNAVAGVINIITRKPQDKLHVKTTAGGGSWGARFGSATALASARDWNLSVGANYFKEDGWKLDAATNHPTAGITRDDLRYAEENKSVGAFADYKERLTLEMIVSDVTYNEIGSIPHWPSQGFVTGTRSFIDLGYIQPLPAAWSFKINAGLNAEDREIVTKQTNAISAADTIATVVETALNGPVGPKTNIIIGGVRENRANKEGSATMRKFSEDHYSGYIQVDTKPTDLLKLVGGLQYNKTPTGHDATVPRGSAIYEISESAAVKLNYGQAFRSATPLEEYLTVPGSLIGNPDLAPERVFSYDAQFLYTKAQSRYTATYFYNHFRDLAERVFISGGAGTQTFRNSGTRDIRGLEFEAKSHITPTLALTGSATLQDEKDDSLFIPDYMVKAGLSYEKNDLKMGVFHSHFGKPKENTPLGNLELNESAHPINLLSLNISYLFHFMNRPITATVFANNLLDDPMNYTEFSRGWVNTLPIGPGRAVYGKLSVEF